MSATFFKELVEFLPKYVSPVKSYVHATLTFIITFIIAKLIINKLDFNFDIDSDGSESETEEKAKMFVEYAVALLISIFVADLAFSASWKIRNRVNGKHKTYARWFKGLYGNI